ncbi:hypothetical protein [Okeania sp. KiyG1]|uniref:hypothetical protein n=1 Tax=Okeania sp. KiyG1 TaxID=2720165 RepID=UPI0019237D88|nr:hypothetical protein [Okeania sp. KiyG1]GGA37729.1 hypothetical protein CYANOKiyG1_55800 [Okeania sp. KiyG1]
MKSRKLLNLATTFPIVRKRKLFKNLLLYPTALLTALSSTFLIQEKTNSIDIENVEIRAPIQVCNEYKNKIYVARARRRVYIGGGRTGIGTRYSTTLQASKVTGWISVLPNQCKNFYTLALDAAHPKNLKSWGQENWIYIESSDNKKFPPQNITSYKKQGRNYTKPEFCVTNKGFNFSSRNYQDSQRIGNRICPGYHDGYQKSTLPEGAYFVRFYYVTSKNNEIVFR